MRVFRTCLHIQILNDISYANIWYKPSQKSSAGSVDRCCCSGCLDATDIFSQTARQSQPRKVRVATYSQILLPDIQPLRKNIATLCGGEALSFNDKVPFNPGLEHKRLSVMRVWEPFVLQSRLERNLVIKAQSLSPAESRNIFPQCTAVAECQAVESDYMSQLSLFLVVIAWLSEKIYQ